MTAPTKATRQKVPPRTLHMIIYECGSICSCRTRGEAELIRATHACACTPACGARIIRYNRGPLYGRGTDTWHRPPPRRDIETAKGGGS